MRLSRHGIYLNDDHLCHPCDAHVWRHPGDIDPPRSLFLWAPAIGLEASMSHVDSGIRLSSRGIPPM